MHPSRARIPRLEQADVLRVLNSHALELTGGGH